MKLQMKRWGYLWLGVATLAQAAYAGEIELEIAPPEPDWFLPPELSPGPCSFAGGFRLEACPKQLLPEGIADVGEQSLIIELTPLLAAGDYEAALARIRLNYGPELVLLEAGDIDGFRATRMPSGGGGALRPPPGARGRDAPSMGFTMDRSAVPLANSPGPLTDTGRQGGANTTRASNMAGPDTISASILYVIGHSYFSLQRYRPAETAFKLVFDALPNHVRAHESLAMLYLRTERYADARVHLARLAELGRNTAHVHSATGYLEQKTRRYSAAANAFQKALVLEPDNRTALRGLLHALSETREYAKAKVLVEQLLQDEPNDPALWLHRAQITLAAGERALAVASLETARRLGDDSAANRLTCVALHMESGNVARAVDLLQGSSARGREFSLVDEALAWLANENEWDDFRGLLASVDRAALSSVEQSRLLTRRASLSMRDGNRRAASTALQEALALDPSNADALMALGQIYRAERDFGRADLVFQRASAYGAVRENALVARANVAIDQENLDGALAHLRNAVSGNPASADLRRNIDLLEDLVLLRTQR